MDKCILTLYIRTIVCYDSAMGRECSSGWVTCCNSSFPLAPLSTVGLTLTSIHKEHTIAMRATPHHHLDIASAVKGFPIEPLTYVRSLGAKCEIIVQFVSLSIAAYKVSFAV